MISIGRKPVSVFAGGTYHGKKLTSMRENNKHGAMLPKSSIGDKNRPPSSP